MNRTVMLIDGARTPFLRAGTEFADLMSYQLAAHAIKGAVDRAGVMPDQVDQVVMGTVVHNVRTPNVAREAALTAGLRQQTPCHTVSQACISANQAYSQAADLIRLGQADLVVAGGVDCASDTPILFRKSMRKKLMASQKLKSTWDYLKFIFKLRPADFLPEKPQVAEWLTNRSMGADCEMLAAKFAITRAAQDEFALRSHTLAQQAQQAGHLAKEIVPVELPPMFQPISHDNGIRVSPLDTLSKLKPAFVKPHGTITAANASFLTDGAAAVVLTAEDSLKRLGLEPKAELLDYVFTGQDLREELLLGPTYAIAKLLKRNNLKLDQIDVIEMHEAFAGQILANLAAMSSREFADENLDGFPLGPIDLGKLNLWGGSLSIGHPFGATGARLLNTAANRLKSEGGKLALVAACAAGAHGHATLIRSL
ncbi:MAG: thiolase family protein [Pirellulales bacterium]